MKIFFGNSGFTGVIKKKNLEWFQEFMFLLLWAQNLVVTAENMKIDKN